MLASRELAADSDSFESKIFSVHLSLLRTSDCFPAQVVPGCHRGSATRPAHRLRVTSQFYTQAKFITKVPAKFILFTHSIYFTHFTFTLTFLTLIVPDSPHLSATSILRILRSSYSTRHIKYKYLSTLQILYYGLFPPYLTFLTHSSHIPDSLYFLIRTANATSWIQVIGLLGLRRGSSRVWLGHPHVSVLRGTCSPYHVFA